jgi:hypothetical protein
VTPCSLLQIEQRFVARYYLPSSEYKKSCRRGRLYVLPTSRLDRVTSKKTLFKRRRTVLPIGTESQIMNFTCKIKHRHRPQGRSNHVARVDKAQVPTSAEGPISLSHQIVICTPTENHPRFKRIRKNLTIAPHNVTRLVFLLENASVFCEK